MDQPQAVKQLAWEGPMYQRFGRNKLQQRLSWFYNVEPAVCFCPAAAPANRHRLAGRFEAALGPPISYGVLRGKFT